jgi:HSP20 family molecular chaperone IbpA
MKSKRTSPQLQSEPAATLLRPQNPQDLSGEIELVHVAIARRAYELFEARGCEHGRDWEDWLRAESEFLRPVSISTSESVDRFTIRASVIGFEENELRVSIEPRRITILGKKQVSATETEGGKVEYIDWYPNQILQRIDLATELIPESSVVELQSGLLKFELPKATRHTVGTTAAAA